MEAEVGDYARSTDSFLCDPTPAPVERGGVTHPESTTVTGNTDPSQDRCPWLGIDGAELPKLEQLAN